MKYFATPEEVFAGKVTDVYFERTIRVLEARCPRKRVFAEIVCKRFPEDWRWAVLSGVEEVAELLARLPVEARACREGSVFCIDEPVMTIEGCYRDFGAFETSILGLLCQASGITTAAARCKKAAGKRLVFSFGARRAHPILAPLVERCAYVAGCDGVSTVGAAELLGIKPSGTVPHSLILLFGSMVEAMRAFDEVIEPEVARVALVDTIGDEKFEALAAAEALGERLFAVRLDTPASRRGDFGKIIEEVRWELDTHGFRHVKIFVSGGIDERTILDLNDLVDGYGVGTRISGAPTVDFSMDIVEVDGEPFAKRGKKSGRKALYRCGKCAGRVVLPARSRRGRCQCGGKLTALLAPLVKNGKRAGRPQTTAAIRKRVAGETEVAQL